MLKLHKLTTLLAILALSTSSLAANKKDKDYKDEYDANNYESAFYKNDGRIAIKGNFGGILSRSKPKLPAATQSPALPVKALTDNGYNLAASATIFFGNYFGVELSSGLQLFRTETSSLYAIGNNYGSQYNTNNPPSPTRKKMIYGIPLTATAIVNCAPFGAINPYIGGGINATYYIAKAKEYKVNATYGFVAQAGVDFIMADDTILNIDIKQYFIKPTITFDSSYVGGTGLKAKLPINPLVVSVGMGWKF